MSNEAKRSEVPMHGPSGAILPVLILGVMLGLGAPDSNAAAGAGHRVLIKGTAYSFDN